MPRRIPLTKREAAEPVATAALTVPGLGITLNGTGVNVNSGSITGNGTIAGSASGSASSISFTGVTVTGAPGCIVKGGGGAAGTVITEAVTVNLKEVNGTDYAVFTPTTPSLFVTITISKAEGKTCAVSGTYKVEGTAALQPELNTMNPTLEATGTAAIQSTFNTDNGTTFNFGAKPAALDVTGDISLTSGETWGVHTGTP